MFDFDVSWDGAEDESLASILDKTETHTGPKGGALNAHLLTTRRSSSISEVIALWMSYPGVPEYLKSNLAFLGFLSIVSISLLSPRAIKLLPDSAGETLRAFEKRGFYRVINKRQLIESLGDAKLAADGIAFLLARRLIEQVDEASYRLLETPLTNIKLSVRVRGDS